MVLTNYPLSSFAVCLGQSAKEANKAALQNYKHQLAVRKSKWINDLSLTKVGHVQYEQTLDASHVGLGNAYAEIQEKYRDQIGAAMQTDFDQRQQYLQESAGGKAAAAGQTGRSINRMQTVDLAEYLRLGENTAYSLTQDARDLGKKGAEAAGKARQAQLEAFAQHYIMKTPELAPPPPALRSVGAQAFMDAMGIVSTAAGVATSVATMNQSDRRLKENIKKIGESIAGLGIYKFNYIGQAKKYIGAMADEVIKVVPEAVVLGDDGFYSVNYGLIDVTLKEV